MPGLEDPNFSARMYAALEPVTDRYVVESGRGDKSVARVIKAPFDQGKAIFDYTQTRFSARPPRRGAEKLCRTLVSNVVGIPEDVLEDVMIPAFEKRADEIIEARLERPTIQLTDHNPNLLSVATQFAENIAIARRLTAGNVGPVLRGMIGRSEGIGTVGYRALGLEILPGIKVMFGDMGRLFTATSYSIPKTPQYDLPGLEREDRNPYNIAMGVRLGTVMREDVPSPRKSRWVTTPANLYRECVISPVGTKEIKSENGDQIMIPAAQKGTGMLVEALGASVVGVHTSFTYDQRGKIVAGECEVGDVLPPAQPGQGMIVVDSYLHEQAAFRSEREDIPVVYAK